MSLSNQAKQNLEIVKQLEELEASYISKGMPKRQAKRKALRVLKNAAVKVGIKMRKKIQNEQDTSNS